MLELAAALAAANACELRGLYVEDQDLLHLAELPFAREVQISQAISRTLKREQLLQDLRAQAGVARAAMMHQAARHRIAWRSEEHTSELQSLMRISYAVFCLKNKTKNLTLTHE